MDSIRSYCEDFIQIKIWNNVNKKIKIVFELEFLISHHQ